jgi:homoserine kinase
MPGMLEAIEAALEAGALAAFVGGAGPTVAALSREDELEEVAKALEAYRGEGRTLVLRIGEGFFWKET